MNIKRLIALTTYFAICSCSVSAKNYTVTSPNGKNVVTVSNGIHLSIRHDNKIIAEVNANIVGIQSIHNIQGARIKKIDESVTAPFYRQTEFQSVANQIDLKLRKEFGMQVRAYDEGIAYRFYTTNKKETVIVDEIADFHFPEDNKAWLAYSTNDEKPFAMAFQNYYNETRLSKAKTNTLFCLLLSKVMVLR